MTFGPKTKTQEQLMARRQQVSELYLQCLSMAEIGVKVGVSAVTVYKDICWAREQWRTRCADAIEALKQKELGRIDHLEIEYWRGYKRSCRDAVTVTHETGSGTLGHGELGQIDKRKTQIVGQAGDPRFLDGVGKCIEQRRRIVGMDAPAVQSIPELARIADVLAAREAKTW